MEQCNSRHDRRPIDNQMDNGQMLRRVETDADNRAREAERSKARIFEVSGNVPLTRNSCTSSIDEDFMLLAAHVDESSTQKIARGEYVNFVKLIQKDKLTLEEDN